MHIHTFRLLTLLFIPGALAMAPRPAAASVRVDFTHSNTLQGPHQNTGDLTLTFSVDATGNVTLDASSADPDPAAFVDEFDGPVGTVRSPAVWGTTFSIVLSGTGALRVDALGSGLGIQGTNPNRIDAATEAIHFTTHLEALRSTDIFRLHAVDYAIATTSSGTAADVTFGTTTFTLPLTGTVGSMDLSTAGSDLPGGAAGTFTLASASDADHQGYGLKGFVFDILPPTPAEPQPFEVPIRVFTPDVRPATETVEIDVPADANPAQALYAQIHNLKFGGQVSLRVNDGEWTHVYNHTVEIREPERGQGGIGGINATLRLELPLLPGDVIPGQANTVSFRLNGSDGIVSSIRILDYDFLDANGTRLAAPSGWTQEDPDEWLPPSSLPADIAAGRNLWTGGTIVSDPIQRTPLKAACASCHFADGSDLKYFNFSNESIVIRSVFHGLTEQQGEQIASYIRTRVTPNPGRPWNPPFQPGPDLDPDPADSPAVALRRAGDWMAGAGLEWVVEDEAAILPHIFPNGTSPAEIAQVIDHEGTFSVREIPVPIQFPDWNSWLPDFAPEDMWPTADYYEVPYQLYLNLRNTVSSRGASGLTASGDLNQTFRIFKDALENWYGTFRLPDEDLANDSAVSLARNATLSREDVVKSLMRWMVIKMTEVTRDFDLESAQDSVSAMQAKGHSNFTPELLSVPGGENRSLVFGLAPHISANRWLHFEHQPEHLGKMESNQWYHLQLCMNSGFRMKVNMNVPLDWAYQINHLESASERTGHWFAMQRIATQIKMMQIRQTGAGITQTGFSQRTLHPFRFYSTPQRDRSLYKGALDRIEPGLWRKLFEEYLQEWLDVIESHDLATMPRSDTDRNQFETETFVPSPWVPGVGNGSFFQLPMENQANSLYRLIPLLAADGIDEMLITDLLEWCKRAWPYNATTWGSTPSWDSLFAPTSIHHENFEDGLSDFLGLTPLAIKDGDYVNKDAIAPKNGGGAWVASGVLGAGPSALTAQGRVSIDLQGATRIRFKARLAFQDDDGIDPGTVTFLPELEFDRFPAEKLPPLTLEPGLFGQEFESHELEITVPPGRKFITSLRLSWERQLGSGTGTVFIDNIQLLPIDETVDSTPPSAPVLTSVTRPSNLRLRANWSATHPPSEGVVGYHVYRRIDGESLASAIRLNTGLVDNPYIRYDDFSARRGVFYRYHLTAVDAAGNESAPSNSLTRDLPDNDPPLPPATLWAQQGPGVLELAWFGVGSWDIGGFDVYRKGAGEGAFTRLTTLPAPNGDLTFTDQAAVDGVEYEYYVESFDIVGNLSQASPILTLTAATGVTHLHAWKQGFNGTNGWDSTNAQIAGNAVDFDGDGHETIWEYLKGTDPTAGDSDMQSLLNGAIVTDVGGRYLELTYHRDETLPPGILVRLQASNDLTTWPLDGIVEGRTPDPAFTVTEGPLQGGTRPITVRIKAPIGTPGSYRFARLIAVEE